MRGATRQRGGRCADRTDFNPHSPCGERPRWERGEIKPTPISIHTPHAGSDPQPPCRLPVHAEISIHTPHAGSDFRMIVRNLMTKISIHTPHAGSDPTLDIRDSTTPISIHTPHAGSDPPTADAARHPRYFNPHSPCGERPPSPLARGWAAQFQSTLPMRGATLRCTRPIEHIGISIHTPHAGSDALRSRL